MGAGVARTPGPRGPEVIMGAGVARTPGPRAGPTAERLSVASSLVTPTMHRGWYRIASKFILKKPSGFNSTK